MSLRSSILGTDGTVGGPSGSPLSPSVVSSSVARYQLKESPGEAVDCASLIQAAYDAGARHIVLDGAVPWFINSPVFFDKTVGLIGTILHQRVTIELTTSARLILGAALPSTTAFLDDPTVKWAFWPGTLRSAYNAETKTVTCTNATSATGEIQQAQPGVRYVGGLVDGGEQNVGLGFGNQCSQIFGCGYRHLKFGISWRGYTDHCGVGRCTGVQSEATETAGSIAGTWLCYQQANGDGVVISPVEADGGGIYHATQAHGAVIVAPISGEYYFKQCSAIEVVGAHVEMPEAGNHKGAAFRINCSQVTFDSDRWDPGLGGSQFPFIEVEDEPGAEFDASFVTVRGCRSLFYPSVKDALRVADIYIKEANNNFRLIVDGHSSAMTVVNGTHANVLPLLVQSGVAGIKAALNHPTYTSFQRALTSSTRWELSRQGPGGAWLVKVGPGGTAAWPLQVTPSTPEAGEAPSIEGTITPGEKVSYAFATVDDNGAFTKCTAAVTNTVGASGAVNLRAVLQAAPAGLMIWRKKEGNPLTEPEAYVLLNWPSTRVQAFDTGAHIAGVSWVTSSVPVPNTVAAASASWEYTRTPDGICIGHYSASPNEVIAAPIGSVCTNTTTGVVYAKTGGAATSSGWVALGEAVAPAYPWEALNELLGWAFDPVSNATTGALSAGGTMMRVAVTPGATLKSIRAVITTKGETLTSGQCFAAVYNAEGKLLGSTADQHTEWESVGEKVMELTAHETGSLTLPAGTKEVFVALIVNGTTKPVFLGTAAATGTALVNSGLTNAKGYRVSTIAALTSVPNTVNFSAWTIATSVRWVGLS